MRILRLFLLNILLLLALQGKPQGGDILKTFVTNQTGISSSTYDGLSTIGPLLRTFNSNGGFQNNIETIGRINIKTRDPKVLVAQYKNQLAQLDLQFAQRERAIAQKAAASGNAASGLLGLAADMAGVGDLGKAVIKGVGKAVTKHVVQSTQQKKLAAQKDAVLGGLMRQMKSLMNTAKTEIIAEHQTAYDEYLHALINCIPEDDERRFISHTQYHKCTIDEIEKNYTWDNADWILPTCPAPAEKYNTFSYKQVKVDYMDVAYRKYGIYLNLFDDKGLLESARKFTEAALSENDKNAEAYAFLAKISDDYFDKYLYSGFAAYLAPKNNLIQKDYKTIKGQYFNKFFDAIENNDVDFVEKGIKYKFHKGLKNPQGSSPLTVAQVLNRTKIVGLLTPELSSSKFQKLVYKALIRDNSTLLDALLSNSKYKINNKRGKTALLIAAENNSINVVPTIIKFGGDIDKSLKYAQKKNNTAQVHFFSNALIKTAMETGDLSQVEKALSYYKQAYYALMDEKLTVYEYAVMHNKQDILNIFIENGLDINIKNPKSDKTLMQLAADSYNTSMYKYLKNKGYNINEEINNVGNLVNYAFEQGNNSLLEFLLKNDVSLSYIGSYGYAPINQTINNFNINKYEQLINYATKGDLDLALNNAIAANNKFFVVRALQKGADINALAGSPVSDGEVSPKELAKQFNNKEIVKIVSNYNRSSEKYNEITENYFKLTSPQDKAAYIDQLVFEAIKGYDNKRNDVTTKDEFIENNINNYNFYIANGTYAPNKAYAKRRIEKYKTKLGKTYGGILISNRRSKEVNHKFIGLALPIFSEWGQYGAMAGLNLTIFGSLRGDMNGIIVNSYWNKLQDVNGIGVAGIGSKIYGNANGIMVGGLGINIKGDARGIVVGGLSNDINGSVTGISVGGLFNAINKNANGIIIGGLMTEVIGNSTGLSIGGIANITHGSVRGLQIGVFNKAAKGLAGLQIGLWNQNERFGFPIINFGFGRRIKKDTKLRKTSIYSSKKIYKTNSEFGKWKKIKLIYKHKTFVDKRDNKTYKAVKIENQWWLAQNLAYKPSRGNVWSYNDDNSTVSQYGYYYDWNTAQDICPSGWHLPNDTEWDILINNCGGKYNAGPEMKNYYSSNSGGFSAIKSNFRKQDGSYFSSGVSLFWSATAGGETTASAVELSVKHNKALHVKKYYKDQGFSVRCIQD